jgi:hypothetical protein
VPCPYPLPLSPAGDLSGHLLAYLSLSPIFVIVGFVTLIIFKRELHTVSLFPPIPSAARSASILQSPSALPSPLCLHLSGGLEPAGWVQSLGLGTASMFTEAQLTDCTCSLDRSHSLGAWH